MKIKFYGATKTVTGSNYLLSIGKYNILFDCGLFQGRKEIEELNNEPFPYNPSDIDYLILSHAHIDHSGRIPKLVKEGFRGKIISTKPTYDLCKIMLMDSAYIQESDAEWENRKRKRANKEPIEPLYTAQDAEDSFKYFETYLYNQKITLTEDIQVRFRDAGHMLGSSIVELWTQDKGDSIKIVFSGDLGMPNKPILNDPEYIDDADYLIIESTYGNRVHEKIEISNQKFIDIINKTMNRGGSVIIPSFAVGRTQELIYVLNKHYEYNEELEEYMKIPVYVDSPMAVAATEAFQANSASFDKETRDLILNGDNPFKFHNLRYVSSQEESQALNKTNFPKIIISSSGMANAGRIRHHLKHNIWDERNSVVFVGYQAEGTLGRLLLDGAKRVKILGEEVAVRAEIHNIEGFSGHADKDMLIDWLNHFKEKPKKIFIVHGEEDSAEALSDLIEDNLGIETVVPNLGDEIDIERQHIELVKAATTTDEQLKEDILEEIETIKEQLGALVGKKEELLEPKLLKNNYDSIKNILIEFQDDIMDLNMLIGK